MFRTLTALALVTALCVPAYAKKNAAPSLEDMKAAWAKAASPGEHHKILEAMVGNWDAKVKHWISGDQAPAETKGSSKTEMILGGRYLRQEYKGEFRGTPIEGLGLIGYDNTAKQYESIWIDSASTDVLVTDGQSEDGKSIKATGKFTDALSGKPGKLRTVTTLVDKDTIHYELYKTRGGKEYQVLDVTYTRAK